MKGNIVIHLLAAIVICALLAMVALVMPLVWMGIQSGWCSVFGLLCEVPR